MSTNNSTLTAARLRHLFNYDENTGLFTRLVQVSSNAKVGALVGAPQSSGHLRIKIDKTRYMAHRLAWLYCTGDWPTGEIDHINGDKTDNRIANLRDVPKEINQQNLRAPRAKSNKTGFLGVTSDHGYNFRARIVVNGKEINLGTFSDPKEAYDAYLEAKRRLHPGCTI